MQAKEVSCGDLISFDRNALVELLNDLVEQRRKTDGLTTTVTMETMRKIRPNEAEPSSA
jgi:hypothetical protein